MSAATAFDGWSLRPMGDSIGAELIGPDLSQPFGEHEFAALKALFVEHPVLVVRGRRLEPEHCMALGRRFGQLEPHSILHYRHPRHPELSYITNVDKDGRVDAFGASKRAVDWHSDGSFKQRPDCVSFLYSIAAPSRGGNTEFTDMYRAYATLSSAQKKRIANLRAFHVRGEGWRTQSPPPPLTDAQRASGDFEGASHPIAIVHPWSGRTSLFVNPAHTRHVVGLEAASSLALLDELYEHATNPAFQYHHTWREGDFLMWDQRAVMHRAGGGSPAGEPRIMLRTMIVSDPHHSN